jgi:antitoxin component YwqK of YwqJK toxin-antitoxin module
MRFLLFIFLMFPILSFAQKQEQNAENQKMIPMSQTYQKNADGKGYRYYERGKSEPFTGVLYGKYDNGNFLTKQEYTDGVGNGYWIDFAPDGKMECKGTYINNKVEGPVTFYYEDGSIKSKGQYLHWKRPVGEWTYYDRAGNIAHKMTYTR